MNPSPLLRPVLILLATLSLCVAGCSPAAKKERQLQLANGYFAKGDYDKAEIEYLNVLKLEALNPHAIGQLGTIYFEQGRTGRAIMFILKAHELRPEDLDLRLKFGHLNLAAGKGKEARDATNYVLDRQPQNPEAPLLLVASIAEPADIEATRARLLGLPAPAPAGAPVLAALGMLELRQGHLPEAEASLKQALAADPKFGAALAALGGLYLVKKDQVLADQYMHQAAEASPPRSTRRLQYAKFKLVTGDLATGKRLLTEITQQTPDYLPAWNALAEVALAEKKHDECSGYIDKALSRDAENLEARALRARLHFAKGENDLAVTAYEKLAANYPKLPGMHYDLARAYLAVGASEKALESLGRVLSIAPEFPDAILLQAELNIRKGELSAAIVPLRKLLQLQPGQRNAQLLLAAAYRGQGNLDEALVLYREIEKTGGGNPQSTIMMGQVLLQQKKTAEAREVFLRAAALLPESAMVLEQLVNADLMEKKPQAARERVEAAIAQYPKLAGPGHLLLAKISLAQGDKVAAEAALKKSIELQPEVSTAYFLLAGLYINTNQQQKALANLQESLARNPKDATALMLTGVIQEQQKNYPAARDAYEKLVAIDARSFIALNNLAWLYFSQFDQIDKALEFALKARELNPQQPNTADTLGWILYHKRQYPRALSLLQEAADRLPDSAEIRYHLGMTHYMMGEETPARLALTQALQGGNFAEVDDARQSLALLTLDSTGPGADIRATLEKALAQRKDDPVALARLSALEEREGHLPQAIKALETALQGNDKNVSALASLARLHAANKDSAKALEFAKAARKLAPDDAAIAYALGRLAYQLGDYTWAAGLLQEAARKLPESPDISLDLAIANYSVGRVAEAETALRNALKPPAVSLSNPSPALFTRAGEARQLLDLISLAANPSEAVKRSAEVELALKADANSVPALMASGAISEQKSDAAVATQSYEKVLARFPDFSPAKLRLAILGAATGKAEFDQKTFDRALQARTVYPNNPELAKALGILTYRKGDHARAVTLLKESSAVLKDDAEIWYYLGQAQFGLKKPMESKAALQRAMELGLKGDAAKEAQRIMEELNKPAK